MKKLTLLSLLAIFLCGNTSFAQNIKETSSSMSQGNQNGIEIELPMSNLKEVESIWKSFVKDIKGKSGKIKKDKKNNEIFVDNSVVKEFGNNTVDIYAQVLEHGDGSKLTVWIDLGGAFLNSKDHPEKYKYMEAELNRFAVRVSKKLIEDELKEQEKVLKGLEKDQKKLEKDKEQLQKDIEDWKKKIADAEEAIKVNEENQTTKGGEIKAQEKVVQEVQKKLDEVK